MSDVVRIDKSLEEFKIFVISSCKIASAFLLAWTSSSPRYIKPKYPLRLIILSLLSTYLWVRFAVPFYRLQNLVSGYHAALLLLFFVSYYRQKELQKPPNITVKKVGDLQRLKKS